MSAIAKLKGQIRQKKQQHGSFNIFQPHQAADENELTILPRKPKSKAPILVVEQESKRSLHRHSREEKKKNGKGVLQEDDDSDSEEEDEGEKKIERLPWGPSNILEHLDNPEVVGDVEAVIQSLHDPSKSDEPELDDNGKKKKKEQVVVWDHGKTEEGRKSDNNFFLWLEAYSALKCNEKKIEENAVFI